MRFTARIGLERAVATIVGQTHERWDGKGLPAGLARGSRAGREGDRARRPGRALPPDGGPGGHACHGAQASGWLVRPRSPGRSSVARTRSRRARGRLSVGRGARGRAAAVRLDPRVTCRRSRRGARRRRRPEVTLLPRPLAWRRAPGRRRSGELGLGDEQSSVVRRAALLSDLGRVGVPNRVWDKPGPLTAAEWERPAPRVPHGACPRPLARARPACGAAGMHHERLDGGGYHRGATAATIPLARLLAAADVFQALTEPRPHRAAVAPEQAARGRGDGRGRGPRSEAASAVCDAAGVALRRGRTSAPWLPGSPTARSRSSDCSRAACRRRRSRGARHRAGHRAHAHRAHLREAGRLDAGRSRPVHGGARPRPA